MFDGFQACKLGREQANGRRWLGKIKLQIKGEDILKIRQRSAFFEAYIIINIISYDFVLNILISHIE